MATILRKSGTYNKPMQISQKAAVNVHREFMPSWNVAEVSRYAGKALRQAHNHIQEQAEASRHKECLRFAQYNY